MAGQEEKCGRRTSFGFQTHSEGVAEGQMGCYTTARDHAVTEHVRFLEIEVDPHRFMYDLQTVLLLGNAGHSPRGADACSYGDKLLII